MTSYDGDTSATKRNHHGAGINEGPDDRLLHDLERLRGRDDAPIPMRRLLDERPAGTPTFLCPGD